MQSRLIRRGLQWLQLDAQFTNAILTVCRSDQQASYSGDICVSARALFIKGKPRVGQVESLAGHPHGVKALSETVSMTDTAPYCFLLSGSIFFLAMVAPSAGRAFYQNQCCVPSPVNGFRRHLLFWELLDPGKSPRVVSDAEESADPKAC
jgi:hypothetical protein